MTEEDRQIMLAVERFAATVTVPLLFETGPELVDQIGTGHCSTMTVACCS